MRIHGLDADNMGILFSSYAAKAWAHGVSNQQVTGTNNLMPSEILSQTRKRLARVSRTNVAVSAESAAAHERVAALEDALTIERSASAEREKGERRVRAHLSGAKGRATDVLALTRAATQGICAVRRAMAQRDAECAKLHAKLGTAAARDARVAHELDIALEVAACAKRAGRKLRVLAGSITGRAARVRADRAERLALARGSKLMRLRSLVRSLLAHCSALAGALRDAREQIQTLCNKRAQDETTCASLQADLVAAAGANVELAADVAAARDSAMRMTEELRHQARCAAEERDRLFSRLHEAEGRANARELAAIRVQHVESVCARLRARCAVLEARCAQQVAVGQRNSPGDSSGGNAMSDGGEDDSASMCVIDLEQIADGDVVVRLPCLHVFHRDCIVPYLQQLDIPICPIDRSIVPVEDLSSLPVWTWTCEMQAQSFSN